MRSAQSGCPTPDRRLLSSILADESSRHILSCLQDGPATVRDLAVALAAADLECARPAVSQDDRRQYQGLLQHNYLPRLTDADLIDRSDTGLLRRVPTTMDGFRVQFPSLDEPDHSSWPAAAAVVCRPYRYTLLSAVADAEGALSVTRLAERLAEGDSAPPGEGTDDPRSFAIALHHIDLPKLESVDLLSYDDVAKTVTDTPTTETVL